MRTLLKLTLVAALSLWAIHYVVESALDNLAGVYTAAPSQLIALAEKRGST